MAPYPFFPKWKLRPTLFILLSLDAATDLAGTRMAQMKFNLANNVPLSPSFPLSMDMDNT